MSLLRRRSSKLTDDRPCPTKVWLAAAVIEDMLTEAEAQVSGACIVCPRGYIHEELICPAANKMYRGVYPGSRRDKSFIRALADRSFIRALQASLTQDPKKIVRQASIKFDAIGWAWRVRRAMGLA